MYTSRSSDDAGSRAEADDAPGAHVAAVPGSRTSRPDGTRSPRIAVFGVFGKSNLGNEATLSAFLGNLEARHPDARVTCIGPHDSDVASRHGPELMRMDPLMVRHHFWPYNHLPLVKDASKVAQVVTEPLRGLRAVERIREFDLLVVPGTGVIGDYGQGVLDVPFHLMRWCRAADRASVPVHFLSVGAERVDSRLTRRVLRRAAQRADYRSFRNEASKRHAEEIGVRAASCDPVVPDLAFSLPRSRLPAGRDASWPPRTVGVGLMGYYGWNEPEEVGERIYRRYIDKIGRFIDWLLDRDYGVRLLIGDTRADARPFDELAGEFGNRRGAGRGSGFVAETMETVDDLLRQIAHTDIVVGTRFHNVLLSLLLERPAISLSYARKNEALMRQVGLERYCQKVDDFNVSRLASHFRELSQRDGGGPAKELRRHNDRFRRRLEEQYDRVLSGPFWNRRPSQHARREEDR